MSCFLLLYNIFIRFYLSKNDECFQFVQMASQDKTAEIHVMTHFMAGYAVLDATVPKRIAITYMDAKQVHV